MLPIVADVHERRSGVPGLLAAGGTQVTIKSLTGGDYRLGTDVLAERKTVRGLHRSLVENRFWRQIGGLRKGRWPYLIVEGFNLFDGPLEPAAVRGALLAVSDVGVTVIRTHDTRDTAEWIRLLALRRSVQPIRRRPPEAKRPRSNPVAPGIAVLAGIRGVSVIRATALLNVFGTVAEVAAATEEELQRTPGLSATLAKRIYESLH
jgi:ERCC4-type nuclease